MTVAELKELLANEPDDKIVIKNGYEGEFDDIETKKDVKVVLNGNTTIWYYGTHVEINERHTQEQKDEAVIALLLT